MVLKRRSPGEAYFSRKWSVKHYLVLSNTDKQGLFIFHLIKQQCGFAKWFVSSWLLLNKKTLFSYVPKEQFKGGNFW